MIPLGIIHRDFVKEGNVAKEFVANIVVCSVCGTPIPKERLEALPGTRTCKLHSQEREKPAETDNTDPEEFRRQMYG